MDEKRKDYLRRAAERRRELLGIIGLLEGDLAALLKHAQHPFEEMATGVTAPDDLVLVVRSLVLTANNAKILLDRAKKRLQEQAVMRFDENP